MKKWLIPAILVLLVSAFASSIVVSDILKSLERPETCLDCHSAIYQKVTFSTNNSDMIVHRQNNISCYDCHSNPDNLSDAAIKNVLLKAKIYQFSLNSINTIMNKNFTLNGSFNVSDFSILRANCTKCHDAKKIKSLIFNHSEVSTCTNCHSMHSEPVESGGTGFWKRMGEGGHRNKTCSDCHGINEQRLDILPQCTKCHVPHQKGAQWDRSICLGCHSDPHIPVKDAVFKGALTKEMCATCHKNIYQVLTTYDSKHNKNVPACINCHPKHKEAKSCMSCHNPHGELHAGSSCGSCHGYVKGCTSCHTNPHAPLSGIPTIIGGDQLTEYAKQAGQRGK